MITLRTLVFAALCLAAVLPAQSAATPAPAASAWKSLFDGTSLAGWAGYASGAPVVKGWSIDDGALHIAAKSGAGDLRSAGEYGDFELRFEWRVSAGANSGIMYRSAAGESAPWVTGPEYQVLDDAGHADGKSPLTAAGSLYAMYPAEGKSCAPVGGWNEGRILARGDHVEHWLNGVRVVDATIGGAEWTARKNACKWKDNAKYASTPRGHIVLQDHGDDVWFRNIRVREFTGADTPLFDGKTFAGWKPFIPGVDAPDTWSISNGELLCAGQPIGYIRTVAQHTNFILHLDWRFNADKAGNSGVLVRQIEEDKVWPRSIEAQLQSGAAGDFWNIGNFVMTAAAERTKGRNTKAQGVNENPLGEWNSYEIEVNGPDVELRVNGRVLNCATACAVVPGHICLQSEGVPIRFRNIRMTVLP